MTNPPAPANAGSHPTAQDSQAVLEAYTAEFGVATLDDSTQQQQNQQHQNQQQSNSRPHAKARLSLGPAQQYAPPDPEAPAAPAAASKVRAVAANDGSGAVPTHSTKPSSRYDDAPGDQVPDSMPSQTRIQAPPKPPRAFPRIMDVSQSTPTQVNDDRDYSEYCEIVPSSPVATTTQQHASNESASLQPDDTGAVNFGLSEPVRPSSQISEDAGFDTTRGDWRRPEETPQLNSSTALTPFKRNDQTFETPALPKNPFAAKGNVVAPFAGSQLFGQTQCSSAVKKISPTSSRPSPNFFNSFSPNIIETSPLKNRANVSSPTDIRTSSPQRLHEIPNTSLDKDGPEAGTPTHSRSTGGEMIPESPSSSSESTPRAQRPRSPPLSSETNGPAARHVPRKKSQERKSSGEPLVSPLDSDSDSDSAMRRMERRKRADKKRAKAAEEMERVSFIQRDRRSSEERPVRKRRRVLSTGSTMGIEVRGVEAGLAKGVELPPVVGDSQKAVTASNETVAFESAKATPTDKAVPAEQIDEDGDTAMHRTKVAVEEERIPATSPVSSLAPTAPPDLPQQSASDPELPILREDETASEADEKDEEPSSLPPQRRTTRTYGRATRQRRKNPFISSSYSDDITTAPPKAQPTLPTLPDAGSSTQDEEAKSEPSTRKSAPAKAEETGQSHSSKRAPKKPHLELPPMKTRSHGGDTSPVTPASRTHEDALSTSSSLSELSSTPRPSAKTTPGTQESFASGRPASSLPSPAKGRPLRKKDALAALKSVSPQPSTRKTRVSKRSMRLDSDSTDELHPSPAESVLEKSMVYTKSSRSFRQSIAPVHRTGRLFEGMLFAISFSNQVKPQERTRLETKIAQAGGTILPEGFQDLFEQSSIMNTTSPVMDEEDALTLTPAHADSGFTALVADGHSRKAKYMQALALGLPCLSQKWVTTCLGKGAIVDWEPYVLCAGVSSVLGNAIRSRMLVPYPAVDARLADVVDGRPRLLGGQRILVVVDARKARSDAKKPYVFLARVLGPSISRVFTVQQAREVLRAHRQAGNPFDWLYMDKGTGTVEAVLAPVDAGAGRKRRRSAPAAQSVVGDIRVLDDELVIQSLILGRMVEEEDMH